MSRKGENIFLRKDGRYEARYPLVRDESGKILKYGFVYGKNYMEAKRRKQGAIENLKEKLARTNILNGNFDEEIKSWIRTKNSIKDSTYYNYLSIIEGRLIPWFRDRKINTIDNNTIQNFIINLKNENLSNKRIKEILLLLNQFLKTKNIQLGFNYPKTNKPQIITFTEQEIKIIEKSSLASKEIKDFAILLTLFTGVRIGELCALKWSDIDLANKVIHINKTIVRVKSNENNFRTIAKLDKPKSENSIRDIPISDYIIERLKYFKENSNEDNFILTNNRNYFPTNVYFNYYKKYLKIHGIKYKKFHNLRHTFATRCLNCGIDVKTLSEILGHSSVKITLDTYVHISLIDKIRQINKIPLITSKN